MTSHGSADRSIRHLTIENYISLVWEVYVGPFRSLGIKSMMSTIGYKRGISLHTAKFLLEFKLQLCGYQLWKRNESRNLPNSCTRFLAQHIILVELLENTPPWRHYNQVQSKIQDQTSVWRHRSIGKMSWSRGEKISLYQKPSLPPLDAA
ncbi:hypothetical protein HPG69_007770 [Diceros bicornis minor]|uniref:Uncharacterized protein n=1 Tax=Diceros bicornis minor TaxID=77932 RepID=A0A7J7EAC0_DICBM|nr:hypothetical protein HPG69_007770 [Diceros bicornis minor]